MKRNLILFAALAISIGVLSLVAMALFTDSDQEIYNDLSEMMVEPCDCPEQRVGEDSTLHEECVDETQTVRSRIGDLDECVIDGLRSLDSPPPAGIESVLECSKEEFGEVRRCMERASEEHEKCSLDFFEATQECQQQLLTIDCSASYDEESKEWMERGSRAFEDCMADGFYLSAFGSMLDAVDGCEPSGPTVCLTDDEVDPHALFQEARRAHGEGDEAGAARYYDQALDAYDFRKLYNLLRGLSDDGTERSLRISSDRKLPTGLIHEVMNTAEVQLAEDHYDDGDAFRQARLDGPAKGWLFPDVFFAVHQ